MKFMRERDLLQRVIIKAGQLLKKSLTQTHKIVYKSAVNIVTEMDKAAENLFVRAIKQTFPEHEVLSEELIEGCGLKYPEKPAGKGKTRWIIDPLDGTTNYAHGLPHFAVSAGIEYNGRVVLGAVYNPMLEELFFAAKGKGAWLNGKRIHVSATGKLSQALLATGFPYDARTSRLNNFKEFRRISHHCQAVRRAGAASLDLCYVACGRFDGFWEYKLKPWDVSAAFLIIAEAGGRATNLSGSGVDIYAGSFIASNGLLHKALVRAIRETGRKRF